ncbi:hypothetical protein B1992_14140 [Pseudoxanthomonas broegbernensis]|uniref:EF-hand domain-containing protein n=1 Tax=Pseudoxanthomonas broegbernensis TaxID=83619 RepID=A0A7V8GK88_9GAMM|nr:hypothetical protein [Pseudoxanthomonas broegbernensis]KAF1684853.1 hypothetical protein B1992_14140 [Pseudoxanthomonas broegbernensis]MBB6065272.1 hypothetical protein [Pseudoxanthomonas broegbernensis]
MLLRGRLTRRRKVLLALLAAALLAVGWAGWAGMAATRGIATADMDWNADGTVARGEILQAMYAVTAQTRREGSRECTTFRWYRSGEAIRVDCRTVFGEDATEAGPAAAPAR